MQNIKDRLELFPACFVFRLYGKQRIPEFARQGLSIRQIADHLRIGSSTVQRVLAKLKEGDGKEGD
ncbi:helix-turn-helix domain-containing protein [Mucilaginibacter gotjawali]|uniref:IS30 family transposase n=2 Tax=Mucilaginibacter gotjawali TaxID=1550579 RepID=A0A839SK56_9SPHI|nr:helix-turn-helix domain-containing protein [Mucilaginibacter gotjawali]MBB3057683.1 IS30 family transposase [Mucilaginibacter gotjawali]BAU52486.1 hypothetical protein MgSA37_00647 [Mucilaginibacter gotjawali]